MAGWSAKLSLVVLVFGFASGSVAADEVCQHDCRLLEFGGHRVMWAQSAAGHPLHLTVAFIVHGSAAIGNTCGSIRRPSFGNAKRPITDADFTAAVSRAMSRWEAAANIRFELISDVATADVVIGAQLAPRGIAFVDLQTSFDDVQERHQIKRAAICLNDQVRWKIGLDTDPTTFDVERVVLHEIGHVLGLDHPSSRGHIMAFRYSEALAELTAGDIKGARHLYGAPPVTRRRESIAGKSGLN